MKLLASVRSSALQQRPSIIANTHLHIPLTCYCSSPVQSYLQLPPSSSSSSSSCSQSKRRFSTRNNRLWNNNNNNNNSPNPSSPTTEPSLSYAVRLLMRRVPHPVAIITTSSSSNSIPRGMTVSSFNTVTLHPKPIISFNVQHPSETLLALQSSGRFVVHLLAPSAAAAQLAKSFARGNQNLELGEFEWEVLDNSNPLPRLKRRRGGRHQHAQEKEEEEEENTSEKDRNFGFVLECQYLPDKTIQVYDHMIVLGTVEKVLYASPRSSTDGKNNERHDDDFCLTYADTRFWKMGEQVE